MTTKMLLAFAALGAGYLSLEVATRPAPVEAGTAIADLTRLIGQTTRADMGTVVTTPAGERARDFRALLPVADRLQVLYGRASANCVDATGSPGCWRIDYVEIDGKPAVPDSIDASIETADIRPPVTPVGMKTEVSVIPPVPALPGPDVPDPDGYHHVAWRMASAVFRNGVPIPRPRPVKTR